MYRGTREENKDDKAHNRAENEKIPAFNFFHRFLLHIPLQLYPTGAEATQSVLLTDKASFL
jgi:hypothetical protein